MPSNKNGYRVNADVGYSAEKLRISGVKQWIIPWSIVGKKLFHCGFQAKHAGARYEKRKGR